MKNTSSVVFIALSLIASVLSASSIPTKALLFSFSCAGCLHESERKTLHIWGIPGNLLELTSGAGTHCNGFSIVSVLSAPGQNTL